MNTRQKAQASLVQSDHANNVTVDLQEKTLQIVRKMQRSCRLCLRSDLEMINLSDEYKDSLTYQGIAVALNIVEVRRTGSLSLRMKYNYKYKNFLD